MLPYVSTRLMTTFESSKPKLAAPEDLLGLAEVSELLGLDPAAALRRLRRAGLRPFRQLRAGGIWHREDVLRYARERVRTHHERPSIIAAAAEEDGGLELDPPDAARVLGVTVEHLLALARARPDLPARWGPHGFAIPQAALARWAAELRPSWREER
jgi:hypothetical protein